jgi:hypothetical protein
MKNKKGQNILIQVDLSTSREATKHARLYKAIRGYQ